MKFSEPSPTISIVTVCRNSAATIGKTIESVLAQKDPGVEYIIIDGDSTDGTQEIVCSYPGVDRFISEPDEGIADAFNKGIALTGGEIVGLLNADDRLAPQALSLVRQHFADDPDADVMHGDILLYEDEDFIKRIKPSGRWWYPWRLVLFNHPATFVRQQVYRQHGGFDATYRIAMDVEIFFRWKSWGVKTKYVPEVLVHMQSGGASGQQAVLGFTEARAAAIGHGLSPFLAHFQFMGKLVLWWGLKLDSQLQKKVRRSGPQ